MELNLITMTISKPALVSLALLAVIVAIVAFLALAPLHRVYSADECRDAYARARTLGDTARIDLHRYAALPGVYHTMLL
jgi:hypothetical protein